MKRFAAKSVVLITSTLLLSGCGDCCSSHNEKESTLTQQEGNQMKRQKTASGLEYEILQEGSGASPQAGKVVTVHYTGWLEELRLLLSTTVNVQTLFIIERTQEQLSLIIENAPIDKQEQLIRTIALLKSSVLGWYALIDYLNFKGNGLNPQEESKGQRWGLLQVLLDMPDQLTSENVNKAFVVSAATILIRLVKNSMPEYRRLRFLPGWLKRAWTYGDATIFKK